VVTVSSWVVMATMPETVAQRLERMEPSLALIVWSAWEGSWTNSGFSLRLALVSARISARKARGRDGWAEGMGQGGS